MILAEDSSILIRMILLRIYKLIKAITIEKSCIENKD